MYYVGMSMYCIYLQCPCMSVHFWLKNIYKTFNFKFKSLNIRLSMHYQFHLVMNDEAINVMCSISHGNISWFFLFRHLYPMVPPVSLPVMSFYQIQKDLLNLTPLQVLTDPAKKEVFSLLECFQFFLCSVSLTIGTHNGYEGYLTEAWRNDLSQAEHKS